jgi:hypothetical protein
MDAPFFLFFVQLQMCTGVRRAHWRSYIVSGGHPEAINQWYFLDFHHVCIYYKPNLCIHEAKIIRKRANNGLRELVSTRFDFSLTWPLDVPVLERAV